MKLDLHIEGLREMQRAFARVTQAHAKAERGTVIKLAQLARTKVARHVRKVYGLTVAQLKNQIRWYAPVAKAGIKGAGYARVWVGYGHRLSITDRTGRRRTISIEGEARAQLEPIAWRVMDERAGDVYRSQLMRFLGRI